MDETARILIEPRPVSYAFLISEVPTIVAAVGKSGPLMCCIKPSVVISGSGLSISAITPSTTSFKLWGGIFVAIPTAIPEVPFNNNIGSLVGSTDGSSKEPSKFGTNLTVSQSISASIAVVILCILASV